MDKTIIIPINLFALNHQLLLAEGEGAAAIGSVTLDNMAEIVNQKCNEYDVENVQLVVSGKFGEELANNIKNYSVINYSNKQINVTVKEL